MNSKRRAVKEKNQTEKFFQSYLTQRGIKYEYEPYGSAERNPDYRFSVDGKTVLVEVKEIETIPIDGIIQSYKNSGSRLFEVSPRRTYDLIRQRIDDAASQLKPHSNDVDYCVVIIGKPNGFRLTLGDVCEAMFGDSVADFIKEHNGDKKIITDRHRMLRIGALRKNIPGARQMQSIHSYISAVGLITAFNGLKCYKVKNFKSICEQKDMKDQKTVTKVKQFEIEWREREKSLPKWYRNPENIFYRIEVLGNPLSPTCLPNGIFRGKWDKTRYLKPHLLYS